MEFRRITNLPPYVFTIAFFGWVSLTRRGYRRLLGVPPELLAHRRQDLVRELGLAA